MEGRGGKVKGEPENKKEGGRKSKKKKRMGDYGGTAGPGIASPDVPKKGKITMVGSLPWQIVR